LWGFCCLMWPVWAVWLVCWIGFCLLSNLSVGLLLEIFLFELMRGCSPKLFEFYFALHEGCSCFCSQDAHCGSLVPMLFWLVGWFSGSLYRGS
jgi:hypothetical protein